MGTFKDIHLKIIHLISFRVPWNITWPSINCLILTGVVTRRQSILDGFEFYEYGSQPTFLFPAWNLIQSTAQCTTFQIGPCIIVLSVKFLCGAGNKVSIIYFQYLAHTFGLCSVSGWVDWNKISCDSRLTSFIICQLTLINQIFDWTLPRTAHLAWNYGLNPSQVIFLRQETPI